MDSLALMRSPDDMVDDLHAPFMVDWRCLLPTLSVDLWLGESIAS